MERPLVTITFVAWMRKELLAKGIESVFSLEYYPIEILIVDNSPTDEIYRWLIETYPQIRCIKTFRPLPLPMVRNILVASALGHYVVFHDDDSRFTESSGLGMAVAYLEKNTEVACLAFRQGNERGEWNAQYDGPSICEAYNYIACAVMFRRTDYFQAGGYFEEFPLYGEELILSLGFFGLGKQIHYFPHVPIVHEQITKGRVKDAGRRYHIADIIMTPGAMLLRAPSPDVFLWYPLLLLRCLARVMVKRRRPIAGLRGLIGAIVWMPTFLRHRHPIAPREFRRWVRTQREYQKGTWERIRKSGRAPW